MGKAHYKGKDLTEVRSPQRKFVPDVSGRIWQANLTVGNSKQVEMHKAITCAKASTTEEPDAGKLHVRVCAGGAR